MGLTLSEYGLENKATGEKVPATSEEEIFRRSSEEKAVEPLRSLEDALSGALRAVKRAF